MKTYLIATLFLLFSSIAFGQDPTPEPSPATASAPPIASAKVSSPHYSLIIGLGTSIIGNTIYQHPSINLSNNAVIIEEADRLRYTATLGFSYTPYMWEIKSIDSEGKPITTYAPKGITVAIFANPLSLSTITGNNTSFDWGAGLGYRFVGLSLLGTVEFFTVRQPKDYFIASFKTNDQPYLINNNLQTEISSTNDNVFRSKAMIAFGLKLVVPIDVLKGIK